MTRRVLTAFAVTMVPAIFKATVPAAVNGTACANLAALTIPNVSIRLASNVPAGPFTPPGVRQEMTLPAFCRVEAVARPTSDSEIRFEVWIPPLDAWNGRFQAVGNGGYQGSISYAAMAAALRRGYATASTDTGHTGDDMKFGQGHPEKIVDYAYRAVHVMTDTAKLIVRSAQGRFADKSYFVGCRSDGPQRARKLACSQRHPRQSTT